MNEPEDQPESYRLLFDCNPQPMWVYDRETFEFLAVNAAAIESYGYLRDEFLSMTIKDIRPPADVPALVETNATGPSGLRHAGVWRHTRKDGSTIAVEINSHRIDFEGRPAVLVLALDVTERIRAMAELAESEERYREMFEADLTGNFISRPDGTILACNETYARIFGFMSVAEVLETPASEVYLCPEDRRAFLDLLREKRRVLRHELLLRRRDGAPIHVVESAYGRFDAGGNLTEIKGFLYDDTRNKRLEEQFHHSQKMEAVGRLAGGIAHDFNNLLTVITGYSAMILERMTPDDPIRPDVVKIETACERASRLTRRLLSFSRKRMVELRAVDLNVVLRDVSSMVERLVGESVEVVWRLEQDLWPVKADSGQLEQVVMNLAANARDAIHDVGALAIETANVTLDDSSLERQAGVDAGDYVLLAMHDTGVGMDEATRSHIFEPFFTTKGPNEGTGLGLSTVYGIVQQIGGTIWVSSEPGRGSTFEIYLPRTHDPVAETPRPSLAPSKVRGTETVLLVEDDDSVRALTLATLRDAGYTVYEAASGAEALELVEHLDDTIHLLLTDVVMPELNGLDLARRTREIRAGIRILFVSGYTGTTAFHSGASELGAAFLAKPFTPNQLLTTLREVLDT